VKCNKNSANTRTLAAHLASRCSTGTLNRSANKATGCQATKSTNKSNPVVKNMYHIMSNNAHLGSEMN